MKNNSLSNKTMQRLVMIRESLSRLGISEPQAFEKFRRFNKRNICGLAVYIIYNILSVMSIICDAETLSEYSDGIFIFSSTMVLNGYFINFVVKTQDTFILIENFENIIQKRKYCSSAREKEFFFMINEFSF